MQHQQQKKIHSKPSSQNLAQKRAKIARVFDQTKCVAIGLKHQWHAMVDDNFGNLTMLDQKPKFHIANF